MIIGANTAFCCMVGLSTNAEAPNAAVERIEPQYDSYKSAPIPATSPTLSPTLSAIVAGLRGSSSGIPASTFPTKSAPHRQLWYKFLLPHGQKSLSRGTHSKCQHGSCDHD